MAEYMNPFAGLQNANFPNNPFWSGVKSAENEQAMAPFMQMEQQRQGLALQEQGMKTQEFQSPEAQATRLSGLKSTTAQNQFNAADAQAKLEQLPLAKKIKLLEMHEELSKIQGAPQQKLFASIGSLAGALDQLPPEERASRWEQGLARIQQTNPGMSIPEEYKKYSDSTFNEAKDILNTLIMNPTFIEKTRLEAQKEAGAMARQQEQSRARIEEQRISTGGTIGAAKIHEAGAKEREQMKIDSGLRNTNPGQWKVANRKILSNPKATVEQKQIAEQNLLDSAADEMVNIWKNDPIMMSLGIKALTDATAETQIETRKRKLYEDHVVEQGLRVRVSHPTKKDPKTGKPLVGTILKSELAEYKKQGYKESQ